MGKNKYKPLNEQEIKFLIDNYNKKTYSEIAKSLNISKSRVFYQAKILREQGIINQTKQHRVTWSFAEEQKLLMLLQDKDKITTEELQQYFPDKTSNQFISKIKKLRSCHIITNIKICNNISTNNENANFILDWTENDIQLLVQEIKNNNLTPLAKLLNKGNYETMMKIYELLDNNRLQQTDLYWNCKQYTDWTKQFDTFIFNHFMDCNKTFIMTNISNKTWKQINNRARLFGLKRDQFLIDNLNNLENQVDNILQNNCVEYKKQKRIDYNENNFFIVDFYIPKTNTIIEVNGDYWHCNPKVFTIPNDIQKQKINNDKRKKAILTKLGYNIIYIWEYDLKNNYQQCVNDIIKVLPPV